VHHALGALGEDGLEKVEELELALENIGDSHRVVSGAEAVTLENLVLFEVGDLELQVVARTAVGNLLLLVVDDVQNLAR